MLEIACNYRVTTKLDNGRRVEEVADLFHHARRALAACFTVVVVFATPRAAFVVDYNKQRDKQWTNDTCQYLTTLRTIMDNIVLLLPGVYRSSSFAYCEFNFLSFVAQDRH